MKTQRLLDLVHFFTFTCHGLLNFQLSCKVNEQVGGYAPKSIDPQRSPSLKWVHMLRKGGAPDGFVTLLPATGWQCSEKWGGQRPRARDFYKVFTAFGWLCSEINTGFLAVRLGGHAPNFVQ